MTSTLSNIPAPSSPMLLPNGQLSPAWWQFFVSLFTRTGSGEGVDSEAMQVLTHDLQALLKTLQEQVSTIPLPSGYRNVMMAGEVKKIPYYDDKEGQ